MNTELRKKAKKDFKKYLLKLIMKFSKKLWKTYEMTVILSL